MTVAIGIYQPRKRSEVEFLRRSIKGYDVDYTFQIGGYLAEGLPGTPHHTWRSLDDLLTYARINPAQEVVALELDTHAVPLGRFDHPENVAYLLGPNTGTIPRDVLDRIGRTAYVETPGHRALDTSAVAAVVLHDRYVTLTQKAVA